MSIIHRPDQVRPSAALAPDGPGCPMSHGNPEVSSWQGILAPERIDRTVRVDRTDRGSARSGYHLGAFTSPTLLLTVHPDPLHPALIAYDPGSLALRWTSRRSDLPADASMRRRVGAPMILAGRSGERAGEQRVIAGNPTEFLAFDADGRELWRRPNTIPREQFSSRHRANGRPASFGGPISLNQLGSGELVTITDDGWLITLDPDTGALLMACPIRRAGPYAERHADQASPPSGTSKSVAVSGQSVYALVTDRPAAGNWSGVRGSADEMVILAVRYRIERGGRRLAEPPSWVPIGRHRAGGSPCLFQRPGRPTLIIANAELGLRRRFPVLVVLDDPGGAAMRVRWWSPLPGRDGDVLHTSPAVDPRTGTLVVTTRDRLLIYPAIDRLSGRVPMPTPIPASALLPGTMRSVPRDAVGLGSPLTLAPGSTSALVLLTNLRLRSGTQTYGHLGAWAVEPSAAATAAVRPLWVMPLTERGAPGPGTLGQAALFRIPGGGSAVWVSTMRDGTFCLQGELR